MKLALMLAVAMLSSTASAQQMERWLLPDPEDMIKASQSLCADQSRSALLAWQYRQQGRAKEDVLALIPESPKAITLRLTSAMRENVEDAYRYPDLSPYTYYVFRSEVCMRETLGAVRMPRLADLHPQVAGCQTEHGPERSAALFSCVRSAVRAVDPK